MIAKGSGSNNQENKLRYSMDLLGFYHSAKKLATGPALALSLAGAAHSAPPVDASTSAKPTLIIAHFDLEKTTEDLTLVGGNNRDNVALDLASDNQAIAQAVKQKFSETALTVTSDQPLQNGLTVSNTIRSTPDMTLFLARLLSKGPGSAAWVTESPDKNKVCFVLLSAKDYELFQGIFGHTFGDLTKNSHFIPQQKLRRMIIDHEEGHCHSNKSEGISTVGADESTKEGVLSVLQGEIDADHALVKNLGHDSSTVEWWAHLRVIEGLSVPQRTSDIIDQPETGSNIFAVGADHSTEFELFHYLEQQNPAFEGHSYLSPENLIQAYGDYTDQYWRMIEQSGVSDLLDQIEAKGIKIKDDPLLKTYLICKLGLQFDDGFKGDDVKLLARQYMESFAYFDRTFKADMKPKFDAVIDKIVAYAQAQEKSENNIALPAPVLQQTARPVSALTP